MAAPVPDPRFTVVIPTHQRAATVMRALRSVLAQQGTTFEVVVVDDGSTDGTDELLAAVEDPRVRVVAQANRGRGAARNTGASSARGSWVTFLDSDDEALPGWLGAFDRAAGPGCGLVRAAVVVVSSEGDVRWEAAGPVHAGLAYPRGTCLPGSFAVRREVLERVGGYDPSLDFAENTELLLRLGLDAQRVGWSTAVLSGCGVRVHREGTGARSERYGDAPRRAAELLLARYPQVLAQERDVRQDYLAIIGTDELRRGRRARALVVFGRSWWARPGSVVGLARMGGVLVPGRVRHRLIAAVRRG